MSDLHVVLGATGGIGAALVQELHARGTPTRAVSRHVTELDVPAGVHAYRADLTDPAAVGSAVGDASVIYHAAQPPYTRWPQEFPGLTSRIADASAAAGATLVVADNLYMYGPHNAPLTELTAQQANDHKGAVRRTMAADLLERHARGDLRVVLGRASDYYGPGGVASALGESLFGRAVAGRPAQAVGRPDRLHTMSFLPDVARALVLLAEQPNAHGQAWHLPAAEPLTGQQLVDLIAACLGKAVRVRTAGRRTLRLLGLANPMLREIADVSYQWEQPFISSSWAFEQAFGPFPVTPHHDAVAQTVSWWQARQAA